MTERRRLGKGLDALLGGGQVGTAAPEAHASPTAQVPLDQIETNPFQPRKDFDPEDLAQLKASLATHGLLQPVVVRPNGKGFQLIAGERRLRAAREAGWTEIPVRIVDFNDQQIFEAALIENLQRSDLNAIEKAQGFQEYMNRYQVTQEELARKIGFDRSTVSNLIRLLELPPDVQDAVRTGQISSGHARALLSLNDPDRQAALCKEVIAKGLSVRTVEMLVKQNKPEANGDAPKPAVEKTRHVQGIEDELRQLFGTRIEIRLKTAEQGQFVIDFTNNDDFERLLAHFRRS
jgi:ParB family chromosome partitioning protein